MASGEAATCAKWETKHQYKLSMPNNDFSSAIVLDGFKGHAWSVV